MIADVVCAFVSWISNLCCKHSSRTYSLSPGWRMKIGKWWEIMSDCVCSWMSTNRDCTNIFCAAVLYGGGNSAGSTLIMTQLQSEECPLLARLCISMSSTRKLCLVVLPRCVSLSCVCARRCSSHVINNERIIFLLSTHNCAHIDDIFQGSHDVDSRLLLISVSIHPWASSYFHEATYRTLPHVFFLKKGIKKETQSYIR